MLPLILLLALSGQPATAPGTVITISADCTRGGVGHAEAYQVMANPVFVGRTFFVGSGKWQAIMAGARVQVVERGFGLVIVSEGTATDDGRMLTRGMLRRPIGW